MNPARLLTVFALLLAAGTPAAAAADPEWEVELLPKHPDWTVTNPSAINGQGWIAGIGGTTSAQRPILWRDGTYVDLLREFPGAEGYKAGAASDINETGWLGGIVVTSSGPGFAALWDGKRGEAHVVHPEARDVPDYKFTHSQILGLNDETEAAGMLRSFPGGSYAGERAYVWGKQGNGGTLLPLPSGHSLSQAAALNNRGLVGGVVWPALGARATACAWIRGGGGTYDIVHIHTLLNEADPAIVRSFVTCVDDHGRVYGVGQDSAFQANWTFVWDERDGVRFLDTDGSVGQVRGTSARVLGGFRGPLFSFNELALAWIREQAFVLPTLPGHAGHLGVDANTRGQVVGLAMHPGNDVWWKGSDAWIATPVHGDE